MFAPLPDKPDHDALEREILELWERERTFEQLRAQNADGPIFSFFDGPVTANKTLGVHTAWGRTLKDVFQRYKALRGYHQRYQNGFDCQGLWIEVGVERELGLNSKREIEEYGLAEFARRCRDVVVRSSQELTKGSIRLGQWMDWGNDYFTFSDTNIEYIWRFLRIVHERGWLYLGHRSTEWCPRCGTSISAHELHGSLRGPHRPVAVRPLPAARPRRRDARRLDDDAVDAARQRRGGGQPGRRVRPARERRLGRRGALPGRDVHAASSRAPSSSGCATTARSTRSGPGADVEHRVIPWDEVALDTGTGIVHIAPGCGGEDFELSRVHDLPVLTPVDEAGRFYPEYGWLHGSRHAEAADQIVGDLGDRGLLVARRAPTSTRYPFCWRCHTPLIFRISDDWFIAVDELRPRLLDGERDRRVDARVHGQAHGRLAAQHGRLEHLAPPLLRSAAAVLPVRRVRPPERDRLAGGAGGAGRLGPRRSSRSSAARGSTRCPIRCAGCEAEVRRIPEVGDVWLDAGIVPFSTLGWENDTFVPDGYATGAAKGLTTADLPDHAYWERWFPADWVSEMREQIRLWFYSQLFMSVALVDRAPFGKVLGYEKMLDEHGREMHGSWGNMIDAEDAFARMGADVMRWQFCAQPPDRNLLFGYGPAHEIKRKLLTLWNSVGFLVQLRQRRVVRCRATPIWRASRRAAPLDRWLVERTRQLVADATAGYERWLTVDVDARLRGLRGRRLELVHPPLAPPLLGGRRGRAARRSGTRSSRAFAWSRR